MSDICREFGETSSGSGSVSPPPQPAGSGTGINQQENIQTPYKNAAEAIYVYRDRRAETKLYDAVVS
jgi:hypothetical protein